MRRPRLKAPKHHALAYYHCVSRITDRQFLLGPEEREKFIALMYEYAKFCGVRVPAFCIMSNHFHVVVEVPKRPETPPDHEWLLERLKGLTVSYPVASATRQLISKFLAEGAVEALRDLVDRITARMWDISHFIKLLKHRFSVWYNRRHDRCGTLWEERFRSTLIEGVGEALAAVSAYIELNPVRARIVTDPADFHWSSYGRACEGEASAIEGVRTVVAGAQRKTVEEISPEQGMLDYRGLLIGNQAATAPGDERSTLVLLGLKKEEILNRVLGRERVPRLQFLQLRVRYFVDGGVIGSKGFVEGIFQDLRELFGPKREHGGSRVQGLDSKEVYTLRNIKKKVFG